MFLPGDCLRIIESYLPLHHRCKEVCTFWSREFNANVLYVEKLSDIAFGNKFTAGCVFGHHYWMTIHDSLFVAYIFDNLGQTCPNIEWVSVVMLNSRNIENIFFKHVGFDDYGKRLYGRNSMPDTLQLHICRFEEYGISQTSVQYDSRINLTVYSSYSPHQDYTRKSIRYAFTVNNWLKMRCFYENALVNLALRNLIELHGNRIKRTEFERYASANFQLAAFMEQHRKFSLIASVSAYTIKYTDSYITLSPRQLKTPDQ